MGMMRLQGDGIEKPRVGEGRREAWTAHSQETTLYLLSVAVAMTTTSAVDVTALLPPLLLALFACLSSFLSFCFLSISFRRLQSVLSFTALSSHLFLFSPLLYFQSLSSSSSSLSLSVGFAPVVSSCSRPGNWRKKISKGRRSMYVSTSVCVCVCERAIIGG